MELAMKAHTDLFFAHIVVKWVFKSAFNEIERAAIDEAIRDEPSLALPSPLLLVRAPAPVAHLRPERARRASGARLS